MKKFTFGLFAGVILTGAVLFSAEKVIDNMDTKAELQDVQYQEYKELINQEAHCLYVNQEC